MEFVQNVGNLFSEPTLMNEFPQFRSKFFEFGQKIRQPGVGTLIQVFLFDRPLSWYRLLRGLLL